MYLIIIEFPKYMEQEAKESPDEIVKLTITVRNFNLLS